MRLDLTLERRRCPPKGFQIPDVQVHGIKPPTSRRRPRRPSWVLLHVYYQELDNEVNVTSPYARIAS